MTGTATHKNEYEIVTDLGKAISNWRDPKDPHLGEAAELETEFRHI